MSDETLSFDLIHPEPLLIIISGPSGVGKDVVIRSLQKRGLPLHFVVTMTSRPPREGEEEGRDYFFVSRERFENLISEDEFLEHAVVYADYKGVPKEQVRKAFASELDVVMRVDVQGAQTLRRLYPGALLIFLIPSNVQEWLDRLAKRGSEADKDLDLRLATARAELEHLSTFDYVVVNAQDRLDEAVDTIAAIITAEHHRVNPRKLNV